MDKMNSKEFINYIGISKWKLEQLEKEGIITPMRDGRIRYYNEEQIAQYQNYLENSVEEEEKDNQVVTLIISQNESMISSSLIEALQYCTKKNIIVDQNIMRVIEGDTIEVIQPILDMMKNGKIARVIYAGDSYLDDFIEKVCEENKIEFTNLIEADSEDEISEGVSSMSFEQPYHKETFKEKMKRIIIGGSN